MMMMLRSRRIRGRLATSALIAVAVFGAALVSVKDSSITVSMPDVRLSEMVDTKKKRRRRRSDDDDGDDDFLIDDDSFADCSEFTSDAEIDAKQCHSADDDFCSSVRDRECGGQLCATINMTNCTSCDGRFGTCLIAALDSLEDLCSTAAAEDLLVDPYLLERRRRRLEATDAPTAAPSYFAFESIPDCDIAAYCNYCADNSTCREVMEAAHSGDYLPYVKRARMSHHGWHAPEAAKILMNLSAVCPSFGW